jgi:hypothetical protein
MIAVNLKQLHDSCDKRDQSLYLALGPVTGTAAGDAIDKHIDRCVYHLIFRELCIPVLRADVSSLIRREVAQLYEK